MLFFLAAFTKYMHILQGPDLETYNRCCSLALHEPGVQTHLMLNLLPVPSVYFYSQSDLRQERGRSSPGNSGTDLGLFCLEGNMDATVSSCLALQM